MKSLNGYRPDIDGLRAIAVLAVIVFHLDKSWLSGGFAGVDIFFVISGYLITKNIVSDVALRRFSILDFYKRRIRRIMPVLSFVIISTLVVSQFVYLPKDVENLSLSALASQFSVANIYFTYFLDTSYFEKNAALEPLLHLWSLGVEEQFYIFWPLVLVLLLGRIKGIFIFLVFFLVAFFSFLLGDFLAASDPMFSYYMLPTRAGELLVGALTYFLLGGGSRLNKYNPIFLDGLALLGLLMVVGSLLLLTEGSTFPGVNALPVTLGTGLIIFSNGVRPTLIGKVLALRPFLLVGLISYSLYLWHWPVLSFFRYVFGDINSQPDLLFISMLVVLALSLLSYRCIESPARNSRGEFSSVFLRHFVIPSLIVLIVSIVFIFTGGYGVYLFNSQYKQRLAESANTPLHSGRFDFVCSENSKGNNQFLIPECVINGVSEPDVLLWGDSTARQYVGVIGENAEKFGFSFRNVSMSSCPPLFSDISDYVSKGRETQCADFNGLVRKNIDNYSVVILSGIWSSYMERGDSFLTELEDTVRFLLDQDKSVLLMGQIPTLNIDNECAGKALKLPWLDCRERLNSPMGGIKSVNAKIASIASRNPGVFYMDVNDFLCDLDWCSPYVDNKIAYFDPHHLSMDGSIWVGKKTRNIDESSEVYKFFSHLKAAGFEGASLPWSRSIEKNPLLQAPPKGTLLTDLQSVSWYGQAGTIRDAGSGRFAIRDGVSDALVSSYFPLNTGQFGGGEKTKIIMMEFDVELPDTGFSLFRIKDVNNSFDARLSVSSETQTYYAHRDLSSTNVAVEFDGNRVRVKLIFSAEREARYSVVIYPSVGPERDKVYSEYVGEILLRDFTAESIVVK